MARYNESYQAYRLYAGDIYCEAFQNATYSPDGQLATAVVGWTNGSCYGAYYNYTISNTYNNRLQTVVISANTQTGSPILNLTYNFNLGNGATGSDNGNVIQIANGKDNNRTQNFIYDPLNRIQQAYTSGPNWGDTYGPVATNPGVAPSTPGIDPWGNLTNISGVIGKTYSETLNCPANTSNQLHPCFNYDAAGNLIQNGTTTYTYDAENRLIAAVGNGYADSYVYDGDGQRIEKCTEGTMPGSCTTNASGTFYWKQTDGTTIAESGLGGFWTAVYGAVRGRVATRTDVSGNSGVIHYYFQDHLHSTSVVTDCCGNILNESDYYPYGSEIVITGNDANRYKFTGKERDSEFGLDNFGARYNASTMGRFMTPDPSNLSVDFWLPQTWNRYAYALNNPVAIVDRNGLWPFYIHNEIIDESFPGMSKEDLQNLKSASWHMDMDLGQQSPEASYEHGMRNGTTNEDPMVAQQNGDNFISDQVEAAQQAQMDWVLQGHSGISPAALTAFGNALHPVTDRISPSHEGNQPWYGEPWYSKRTRAHVWGEMTITDAQRAAARDAAQKLFHRTFGNQFDWMLFRQKKQTACVTWHDSASGESGGGCQ